MRVLCRSGHFAFYPRRASDIARFSNFFGADLVSERDYYTFTELSDAPSYSLLGLPYLGVPAIKTYEGEPWEVMRENNFVFHISLGLLVPKFSIVSLVDLPLTGYYFTSTSPLIQPGALLTTGQRIMSYGAEFIDEGYGLRVLEYDYE